MMCYLLEIVTVLTGLACGKSSRVLGLVDLCYGVEFFDGEPSNKVVTCYLVFI